VIVMGMGYLCPLDYEYKNLQFWLSAHYI
jgi:hypothetical protein